MRILIATGIYPPEIGGPAVYAQNLENEFLRKGHSVKILTYRLEKKLPGGMRHFLYFLRTIFHLRSAHFVLALDTFSVGVPALLAAKLLRKKFVVRVGGDFLWESYVARSGEHISLAHFYKKKTLLNFKEKIIFRLTKFLLHKSDTIVFSTTWQRDIFIQGYSLFLKKTHIIENYYGKKEISHEPIVKNFLWAGRPLVLKNIALLRRAFAEAKTENPDIELETGQFSRDILMDKIKNCYADILPSFSDVSPNFILDAIRFNKPFIVTQETGLREKLKDIALFIDPFDEGDVKKKILYLANDHNYEVCKKRISSFTFTHSWQEIVDEFLRIYQHLTPDN